MYQALLFDLDGTLTASGEGITKSIQYALRKMGYESLAEDLKQNRALPTIENVTMWLDIMRINLIRGFASFCQN